MMLEAGQVLGARFRLVHWIGEDALGEVWRASDRVPSRLVDLRVMTKASVARDVVEGFVAEMRTARGLRHRAMARVIEVGAEASGVPWLATEVLRGESLQAVLVRRDVISPPAALKLIAELAECVAELHTLGLVHRGIQPRSVMLHVEPDATASAKLVDLGLERFFVSSNESRMDGYRSVELSLGAPATRASDVWALGVLLFRCLTGRLPFATLADTTTQPDLERMLRERVEDPSVIRLVRDCLRPARDERISAGELADRAQLLGSTSLGGWDDVVEPKVRVAQLPEPVAAIGEAPHHDRASEPVRPPRPYEGLLDGTRRKRVLAALLAVGATVAVVRATHERPGLPYVIADRVAAVEAKPHEVIAPAVPTNCASPPPVPAVASVSTPPAKPLPPKPAAPKPKPPLDDDNPYYE